MGGRGSAWYAIEGEAMQVKGGSSKNALAAEVMRTFASIGLDATGIDASTEEGRAALAEKASRYKQYLAPHLAAGMLPMDASDTQVASAREYLSAYADRFAATGELSGFDTRHFATNIAGKKSELNWLVGGEGESLASQSPLAAFVGGASAEKLDQNNPGKSGAKMGLQSVFQGMVRQTRAFFKGHDAATVEEHFAAITGQAPEVTPQTRAAIERMGGAGEGVSARSQIAHLNPANAPAPSEAIPFDPALTPYYEEVVSNFGTDHPDYETAVSALNNTSPAPSSGDAWGGMGAAPPAPPSGGGNLPPFDGPEENGFPEPQMPRSGGSSTTTNIYRNVIPGLSQQDVQDAFSSLSYLQGRRGRIGEIGEMLRAGSDIAPIAGEVDAIRTAARRVQGVYSRARQRRDFGMATGEADALAKPMFDPGSSQAVDPLLNEVGDDLAVMNDQFVQYKLARKETTGTRGQRGPTSREYAAFQAGEARLETAEGAISSLKGMKTTLKEFADEVEKTNRIQKSHLETVKNVSKAYEGLEKLATKLEGISKNRQLTEGEQAMYEKIAGEGGLLHRFGGDVRRFQGIRDAATLGVLDVVEDRTRRNKWDVLFEGGKEGARHRREMADEGEINIAERAVGAMGRGLERAIRGQGLFHARLGFNMWAGPVMGMADEYLRTQATQELAALQAGQLGYSDLMAGQYGQIMRRQIGMEELQLGVGRQTFAAYGGLVDAFTGEGGNVGRSMLGAAGGIGLPALGVGVGLASLTGNPLIGAIGAGVSALAGGYGYMTSSATNYSAIGEFRQSMRGDNTLGNLVGQLFQNTEGVAGQFWNDFLAGIGQQSEEQRAKVQGSEAMLDLINRYATGGIGRSEAAQQAQALGFTEGELVSGGIEQYLTGQTAAGVDRQTALANYQYFATYNPQLMPNAGQSQVMTALNRANVNMAGIAPSLAAAFNFSQFDQGIMSQVNEFYANTIAGQQNPALFAQQLHFSAQGVAGMNNALRLGGLDAYTVRPEDMIYSGMTNDPLRFGMYAQNRAMLGDMRSRNAGFIDQGFGQFYGQVEGLILQGDYVNAQRAQRQGAQMLPLYEQYLAYGADAQQIVPQLQQMAWLGQEQFNVASAFNAGDRLLMSQNWQAMIGQTDLRGRTISARDAIRFQTVDPNSGMGAYYSNVSAHEAAYLRGADRYNEFRLTNAEAALGEEGWAQQIRLQQRDLEAYQFEQQTLQRNLGFQMTVGGATGVNGQGFAVGGDGLRGLAGLFQQAGMAFNAGNGMGMWQLQDAGTLLQREQQMFGYQQQGQMLGLQQQQFNLAGQQFYERFGLNQQQFRWQTGFQRQEMQIGRQQQVAQQQWQTEDLSFNRNMMDVQFGFQMRDFDRNIRYARGRERLDLIRHRDDATILYSMQAGQSDKQMERHEEQIKWADEEFERRKKHFEEGVKFQERDMDMQKKHFEEGRRFDQQRLDLQRQAHERQLGWMRQQWAIEDQQRLLERQMTILQQQMQTELANRVRSTQLETQRFGDALSYTGKRLGEANMEISTMASKGYLLGGALKAASNEMTNLINAANKFASSAAAAGKDSAKIGGKGYAGGGYTGDGMPDEVAGVVHKREYVVPEKGALVIRGDNSESVMVLKEIAAVLRDIRAMGPGRVNAYISTNRDQLHTSEFTAKDRAYSHIRQ
jgi:hypothetical protein